MGGKNPYIEETKYTPATKKFKVTFIKDGKPVESRPGEISLRPRWPARQHPRYLAGLPHRSRPRLWRRLRLLHVPRDRSRRPRLLQRSHRRRTRSARRSPRRHAEIAPRLPMRSRRHKGHRGGNSRVEQKLREGSRSLVSTRRRIGGAATLIVSVARVFRPEAFPVSKSEEAPNPCHQHSTGTMWKK